jgi:hypothetical protein
MKRNQQIKIKSFYSSEGFFDDDYVNQFLEKIKPDDLISITQSQSSVFNTNGEWPKMETELNLTICYKETIL